MHIETLAVHAGHGVDRATGAVTPPIHLSTTFGREADGSHFTWERTDRVNALRAAAGLGRAAGR